MVLMVALSLNLAACKSDEEKAMDALKSSFNKKPSAETRAKIKKALEYDPNMFGDEKALTTEEALNTMFGTKKKD